MTHSKIQSEPMLEAAVLEYVEEIDVSQPASWNPHVSFIWKPFTEAGKRPFAAYVPHHSELCLATEAAVPAARSSRTPDVSK